MKKAEDRVYELHGMKPPRRESNTSQISIWLSMMLGFFWSYVAATLFFMLVFQHSWEEPLVYNPSLICATAWNVLSYFLSYHKKLRFGKKGGTLQFKNR